MKRLSRPMVSVIVLNWNGLQHLPDCLDSLKCQEFKDFEVILVDNGSTDDSLGYVRSEHPWVKVVSLEKNMGFAHGNNVGFRHSQGEYLVTLNNDTRVEEGWLKALVEVAQENPGVGMVGSRICSFQKPDIIDSLGVNICPDGMSRGGFRNQLFSELNISGKMEILIPSACAALYKRAMVEEIGCFFDDDFFAYCEDTDLGLRGRLAGWAALLSTDAVVYHKYSQTGGFFSPFKLYHVERNHYWVVLKSFPKRCLLTLPLYTIWRYAEQFRALFLRGGSGQDFHVSGQRLACIVALIKGHLDAILSLPKMLKKRREIMAKRRITSCQFMQLIKQYRLSFRELLDNKG